VVRRFDELLTPRLRLRRWLDADREPFAAMNADPEVMRYFPATLNRAASDGMVKRLEARFEEQGYGLWALERLEDGAFLGFTGLNPMPPGTPGAGGMEVGWRLAPAAWGQGYATEAATAALELWFGPLGGTRIWSITSLGNLRSQAVMRRIGLTEHARYRQPSLPPEHELSEAVAYSAAPPDR
jgi:RimJ/RimL family protein N-acetyltransferase